jgi:hypothetical protein
MWHRDLQPFQSGNWKNTSSRRTKKKSEARAQTDDTRSNPPVEIDAALENLTVIKAVCESIAAKGKAAEEERA